MHLKPVVITNGEIGEIYRREIGRGRNGGEVEFFTKDEEEQLK
jgi:hypothetical protein